MTSQHVVLYSKDYYIVWGEILTMKSCLEEDMQTS